MKKQPAIFFLIVWALTGCVTTISGTPSAFTPTPTNGPVLADPDKFEVELYADFSDLGRLKAFHLTLTAGQNGFPAGLYVTTGPVGDDRSDRLVRIDGPDEISVVKEGFTSNETMVFAKGEYGEGMLITEPLNMRILRLLPSGELTVFSELGTEPFGPAGLFFDSDDQLYVTDFSGGTVLHIDPEGRSEVYAEIPIPPLAADEEAGPKGGCESLFCGGGFGGGGAGGDFIIGVFAAGPEPTELGAIYNVSDDGNTIAKIAQSIDGINLDGINFMAEGPEGDFDLGLFIPTVGGSDNADGGVYILDTEGVLTTFMTGIDAASIAFDLEGVLGGGMFVSDLNDRNGAGKVWRVTPRNQ